MLHLVVEVDIVIDPYACTFFIIKTNMNTKYNELSPVYGTVIVESRVEYRGSWEGLRPLVGQLRPPQSLNSNILEGLSK